MVRFHLQVNMQSIASGTIHTGYTVHIYSKIFEWRCVWLCICMHALVLCECVWVKVSRCLFCLPHCHLCPPVAFDAERHSPLCDPPSCLHSRGGHRKVMDSTMHNKHWEVEDAQWWRWGVQPASIFPVVHAKVFLSSPVRGEAGLPLRSSVQWLGLFSVSLFGYLHSP